MSTRTLQIGATIQRSIQTVLSRGLSDPRIKGIITVTRVQIGDDLREAYVFVTVTPAEHEDLTMHGLRSAERHIRHAISDNLSLKQTPQLRFRIDKAFKAESELHSVLNKALRELDEGQQAQDQEPIETPEDGQ